MENDGNIVGNLAKEWAFSDDSTELNVKIIEGVKFHNGEELKASDVKFTLDRDIASPHIGHIVEMIEEVEINGDYEVTIILKYPFGPLLSHLSHTATSIVSEKAVTDLGDRYSQQPVGTGPFRLDRLVTGDRVELVRFEDYHGKAPLLRTITMRTVPENANRAIELETGGVDIAYAISPEDISRVDSNRDTVMIRDKNFSMAYIGFNTQKAPLDDVRVRQAISYAIDKSAIVQSVYQGTGAPANGPLADKVWASIGSELEPYEEDLTKARELMKEAGHEDGFKTTIWVNDGNVQRRDIAEIVQNQLRRINIDCSVEIIEWASLLDRTSAGEHDIIILGWVTVTGDPDYGLYAPFHSAMHGAAGNRSFYTNKEVDDLLDAGRLATDPDEREKIYAEAQQIIRDDAVWIFLWQGEDLTGVRSNVRGFQHSPGGHHPLWNVYFE